MKQTEFGPPRKRLRLTPEVRTRQILAAALAEFSQHGFASARMEDIANRAGLSKSGLYAHFASKDEIFERLLVDVLTPAADTGVWLLPGESRVQDAVDAFLDRVYGKLADPEVLAMLRLMISESGRAPHLIRRWREEVVQRHFDEQQAIVRQAVAQGRLRSSTLTDNFSLISAPALYAAIWQMTFTACESGDMVATIRQAHRRLLLELLTPEAEADAGAVEAPVPRSAAC